MTDMKTALVNLIEQEADVDLARAELGRVARRVLLVCHEAHLLRVLLSGKPGAVQTARRRRRRHPVLGRGYPRPASLV